MKSIKQKLIVFVGVLFLCVCVALSGISYINASRVLESSTQNNLSQLSKQSSQTISSMINGDLRVLASVADKAALKNDEKTVEQKVNNIQTDVERIGCLRMAYIDANGDSLSTNGKEQNLADREYFTEAMAGNTYVSDPTVGKTSGDLLVFYSAPIKSEAGNVIAVLQEVQDGNNLSELTNTVAFGNTGFAYIVNAEGRIIAHPESDLVMNETNIIESAKSDESYVTWAAAVEKAFQEKNGFTTYYRDGIEKYVGFAEVEGTNWELFVCINKSEILSGLNTLKFVSILTSLISLVVGIIIAYYIAHSIAKGITASSVTLGDLAAGDLTVSVDETFIKQKDEVGDMSRAMKEMASAISTAIKNIKNNSTNIDEQSEHLSSTADEISSVSQNVAESISEIADGTVTQSENLARIKDILDDFGVMMNKVVQEIHDVDDTSNSINEKAVISREEMTEINDSVERVEELFETFREKIDSLGNNISEINQFTNVINEISSQTNLLALNASIEAARAGEAGRGFAVVAEEIGHLAEQSQESSEKISQLVVGISQETNKIIDETAVMDTELTQQSDVIKKTIESFQDIIVSIDEVLPKISTAETTIKELDELKDTIVKDVEEISAVSAQVSASSQDISAAAEELSASMHEMTSIAVTLKDSTGEMRDSVEEFKVE